MSRAEPVAIVTGGGCDAGRRVARELAARGYAVVVVYLSSRGDAEATVDAIVAADGAALTLRADLDDELDVARMFEETEAAFGAADVLVDASGADALPPLVAGELRARGIAGRVAHADRARG